MHLVISDSIGDVEIFSIASCIERIDNLQIHAGLVTMNGFQRLHNAIQSRPSQVNNKTFVFMLLLEFMSIITL